MERTRTFRRAVAAVVLGFAGWPISPRPADAVELASYASCYLEVHETATPGYDLTPDPGHNVNPGGPITCTGRVQGKALAGTPGVVRWDVHHELGGVLGMWGTCLTDAGKGPISVDLPTADGTTISLAGTISYTNVGTEGVAQGTLGAFGFVAFLQSMPEPGHLDENCATTPLRHFMTVGPLLLKGGEG
jgi:hypothetical protein